VDGATGNTSDFSAPCRFTRGLALFILDRDRRERNDCDYASPGGWEFVPVTSVGSTPVGPLPQGAPMFNLTACGRSSMFANQPRRGLAWLGGDGALSSANGLYSVDSVWFTIAGGATSTGRTRLSSMRSSC